MVAQEFQLVLRQALEEELQAHGEVVFVWWNEFSLHLVEALVQAVLDGLHEWEVLEAEQGVLLHSVLQRSGRFLKILI